MAVVRSLLDLAVGRCCLQCGRPGQVWCERCLRSVLQVHRRATPAGVVVRAGSRYAGSVSAAVVSHKERGQLSLATPLARILMAAMDPPAGAIVVPAPSQRAAVRARGHDHAARLALHAARICGGRTMTPLRWTRTVDDQAGLGVAGRSRNVRGAMKASGPRGSGTVWLVDDIVTTGATIDEAVRALTASGWVVAGVAVVASVESRMALADGPTLR